MPLESICGLCLIVSLLGRYVPQTIIQIANRRLEVACSPPTTTRSSHVAIALAVLALYSLVSLRLDPLDPIRAAVAVFLCFAGATLGLSAVLHLRHHYSEELVVYMNARLVTSGPYSLVRHPARTGMFLEACGLAAVPFDSWACLGVLWLLSLSIIRSREEDIILVSHFGPTAIDYQSSTPACNLLVGVVRRVFTPRRATGLPQGRGIPETQALRPYGGGIHSSERGSYVE